MNYSDDQQSIIVAWEDFIKTGKIGSGYVRPEISYSWNRCKSYGINPLGNGSNLILNDTRLEELRLKKRDLIQVARPIMENLFKFVAGTGFLIFLSDERGFIIEMLGDCDIREDALKVNLIPGSNWLEEQGGTNGIGTALALQKPVQINGAEHYIKGVHAWTCSAAPVRGDRGDIIGALQMSGPSYATHLHTLGMIVAAVQAVEEQLQVQQRNRELTLVNSRLSNIFYHMSDGVISFDSDGVSTHVNPAAEKILDKTAVSLLNKKIDSIFSGRDSTKIKDFLKKGKSFSDMEVFLDSGNFSNSSCLVSGDIIKDDKNNTSGSVLIIKSFNKINNLVNRLSGAQANFYFDDIIGQSLEIRKTIRLAMLAAKSDSTVLLQGESGTGKEIFAQAIHNASFRKNGPFVALNCGAIPGELIDSELFGYVEGAFTGAKRGGRPGKFELASGGTLFLDEIGDMNFSKQVSLLRAIQERKIVRVGGDKVIPVNVRIIAATNKNLQEAVQKGIFRQDLYYRLNVISISLPPLRCRLDDIPLLFNYFLHLECQRMKKKIDKIDPDVILALQKYHWPGNIRELQNVTERMACIVDKGRLRLEDLPQEILNVDLNSLGSPNSVAAVKKISINQERQERKRKHEELEKEQIVQYLVQFGGNISKVAEKMSVSRTTIYRKIKTYGIESF